MCFLILLVACEVQEDLLSAHLLQQKSGQGPNVSARAVGVRPSVIPNEGCVRHDTRAVGHNPFKRHFPFTEWPGLDSLWMPFGKTQ
jgi:hypothetical protein